MKRWSRRGALGTAMALCQFPATAADPASTQEAQTRLGIETYARAWERGDIPALLNCYHPDFTLNYFGHNALAGRHTGKAASIKVLVDMGRRTSRKLKAITALMVGGDRAAMLTRESMEANGLSVEVDRLYLYTVHGEQLLECWVYDQDQRQIDQLVGA